ncbi:MAG: S41 family peptidase [Anditalea sp.]
MKARMKTIGTVVVPLLVLFSFISCNEEIEDPQYIPLKVKEAIFEGMQEWYYWNAELPHTLNLANYQSNEELLEVLKYKTFDKWSYLTTREDFDKAFTGQNAGHGVGFTIDSDERIFLAFVYEDSPAGKDNWQRGWEIVEVNGKPVPFYRRGNGYDFQLGPDNTGISNTFKFRTQDGDILERTIPKAEYQSNSVLYQNVLEENGKRIGYWVYNSFKATPGIEPTTSVEVEESMNYFEENQIDELIIDLRYNGGGSVEVAEQLMNYLIPVGSSDMLMYTNAFNEDRSDLNEDQYFEKKGQINLNRIIFITSRGSASSSELIINCLLPYLEVVLIGDNTYGKPVGAFPLSGFYKALEENNVELVPITFAIANAEGKAAYYEGFPVNFQIADDPAKNWGDQEEKRFKAALEFIRTGTVDARSRAFYVPPSWAMIDDFDGLKKEFPAY